VDDAPLRRALESSQRLGLLGAAPIPEVVAHSEAFVAALDGVAGTVLDLGSGGGVPGLVIAWRRPDLDVVLVDRRQTRTDHLRRLVSSLELDSRVAVLTTEARALPRLLAAPAAAVVARGFGPPATVLAVARPVLADGGLLVVSEPPNGPNRWTAEVLGGDFVRHAAPHVAVLRHVPRGSST
jgi:16S rRNA (guanine527-N7)-methyltransferase